MIKEFLKTMAAVVVGVIVADMAKKKLGLA